MRRLCSLLAFVALGCGESPTEPVAPEPDHPLVGTWISEGEPYHIAGRRVTSVTTLEMHPDGTVWMVAHSATDDDPDYPTGTILGDASGFWQETDGTVAFLWDRVEGEARSVFQVLRAWWWPENDRLVLTRDTGVWIMHKEGTA